MKIEKENEKVNKSNNIGEFFVSNDIDVNDVFFEPYILGIDFNGVRNTSIPTQQLNLDENLEKCILDYEEATFDDYRRNDIANIVNDLLDLDYLNYEKIPYILANGLYLNKDKIRLFNLLCKNSYLYIDLNEILIELLSSIEFKTEEELKIRDSLLSHIPSKSKFIYMVLTRVKLSDEERNKYEDALNKSEDEYSYQCKFYYKILNSDEKLLSLFSKGQPCPPYENAIFYFIHNSDKFNDKDLMQEFIAQYRNLYTLKLDMQVKQILSNNQNRTRNIELPRQYIKGESKIKIKSNIRFK